MRCQSLFKCYRPSVGLRRILRSSLCKVRRLFQLRGDRRKGALELRAHAIHDSDDGDGNAGGDQAVFDGRSTEVRWAAGYNCGGRELRGGAMLAQVGFLLWALAVGLVFGFIIGYAVRERISRRRRAVARAAADEERISRTRWQSDAASP